MANSEDPDEITHKAAFHKGLTKSIFRERIQYFWENIICDPPIIECIELNLLYLSVW